MSAPYIIYGMDASYFTQKALSLLSYKEIPTDFRKKSIAVRAEVEQKSGTHMMPVMVTPQDEWMWDTTPIAFELDKRFPKSAILPPAPLARIIARILEDFFDEWTTRAAIFFRWNSPEDIAHSGDSLARDAVGIPQNIPLDATGQKLVRQARDMIETWARKTIEKLDAHNNAHGEIIGEYSRLMTLLDQHFAVSDFLLGSKPCLADFALQGALTAHFLFDPTPRMLTEKIAPAVVAYQQRMKAAKASRLGEDWPMMTTVPETLAPVLQHIAMGFHAYLAGNQKALKAGRTMVDVDLGYGPRTIIARPYTEKTRIETAKDFHSLSPEDQKIVSKALSPLGVMEAYLLPA
ncbi:glutathione S-transferase [Iodidimonas gelatinilytica]|uniref:Glutathione S-transferase n=1 Tax=Iodidimonas gelatinilytica TaxID=1236966 RepID=A0A5A7MZU8_9PROT|nr:glutathione S-transferase family protein [Iodidimonas gelatinilytica]GEQ96962.1 glutathione S-transferase [Iodidimonas gelatinilytica]GER00489.1 glutathione S-transferase [Iodidimonas gelatinilytica]